MKKLIKITTGYIVEDVFGEEMIINSPVVVDISKMEKGINLIDKEGNVIAIIEDYYKE